MTIDQINRVQGLFKALPNFESYAVHNQSIKSVESAEGGRLLKVIFECPAILERSSIKLNLEDVKTDKFNLDTWVLKINGEITAIFQTNYWA